MQRIVLGPTEKKAALAALPLWSHTPIRRGGLETLAATYQVPAKEAYTSLLHLDTLDAIGENAPLIWKGGTAIQSHLPPDIQRISTDLDFNSTTKSIEILRETIQETNIRLEERGAIIPLHGIDYGRFFESDHRPPHSTIEFRRILPTPFDELLIVRAGTFPAQEEDIRIQGRLSRVQINYRHTEFPALKTDQGPVRFFTQPGFEPPHPIHIQRASIPDLVADKILATTRHEGFGRERFKDVYDLVALRHLGATDPLDVQQKLNRIVGSQTPKIIEGSIETLGILSAEHANAQGFRQTVCRGGKAWVDAWEHEVSATQEWLMELLGADAS
jgi:hypothetical protein